MPIYKCESNGKYRIGTGGCVYDTHEKAAKVWAAILAGGNYAAKKVSYDYDGVLSTDAGKEKVKRDIAAGNLVYVISARGDKESMLGTAKDLGIPADRVYATGSNKAKVEKVSSLGIKIHTDNNPDVIKEVNALPKARGIKFEFEETYNDYPESASNNAKRALKWADENGWGSCGTAVGKARANQLAKKENISRDTIARMASFKRQQQNKDVPYSEGCGGLMWDAWGGTSGVEWAINKLQQIDKTKLAEGMPHYTKDGILWTGDTHKDESGKLMTGAVHTEDSEYLYHKEDLAEVGERGGIKSSPKAPKSDTKNQDPKGEGSAKGDAGGKSGADVPKDVQETLQNKADEFNDRYKEKLGYGANIGALKSVYQRGLGAYNTSHSPFVKSPKQWAMARVNAFLYLIKNGRPENKKYDSDFDLLPTKHPKYPN